MKQKYTIFTPEQDASRYLGWEFGPDFNLEVLEELPRDARGWVDFAWTPFYGDARYTMRAAAFLRTHVMVVLAYLDRKEGRSLFAGAGCVDVERAES